MSSDPTPQEQLAFLRTLTKEGDVTRDQLIKSLKSARRVIGEVADEEEDPLHRAMMKAIKDEMDEIGTEMEWMRIIEDNSDT